MIQFIFINVFAEQTVINSNQVQDPILLEEDVELPLFDLDAVALATSNFSFENKIGEGGFGPVYKVLLLSTILTFYFLYVLIAKCIYVCTCSILYRARSQLDKK